MSPSSRATEVQRSQKQGQKMVKVAIVTLYTRNIHRMKYY